VQRGASLGRPVEVPGPNDPAFVLNYGCEIMAHWTNVCFKHGIHRVAPD